MFNKILNICFFLILFFLEFINVFSSFIKLEEVDCNSNDIINGNICNKCYKEYIYVGKIFNHGLSYNNYSNNSYIISVGISNTILDLNPLYFIHNGNNDLRPITNYIPSNKNNILLFLNKKLKVINHPVNKDIRIGRILYKLVYTNEIDHGNNFININLNYYIKPNLYSYEGLINYKLGLTKKYLNLFNINTENYCYNFFASWCGDGLKNGNEQCDDGNNISGDGCDSSCKIEENINSICGNFILEGNEQCDDGNNISGDGCDSSCKIENIFDSAICGNINISGKNITCFGNYKVKSFKLDCGNGDIKYLPANLTDNGFKKATFYCNSYFSPKCFVSEKDIGYILSNNDYFGWTTRNQCQAKLIPYCGDGVIQKWRGEECEKDKNGIFPPICKNNCKLDFNIINTNYSSTGKIIIPNHGSIIFGHKNNIFLYREENLSTKLNSPYIYNNSDYDINIDSLCIDYYSGTTLTLNSKYRCKKLPGILYPGKKFYFDNAYNGIKGKKVYNGDFEDNIFKITLKSYNGNIYSNHKFSENIKIRVVNPSIITLGGGITYLENIDNLSDINKLSNGILDDIYLEKNKNFIGAGISNLSSVSKNIIHKNIKDKIKESEFNYISNLGKLLNNNNYNFSTGSNYIMSLKDGNIYNGIKNIFIFNNVDVKIDDYSELNYFSGSITFIINNGNLIINSNIKYDSNVAFIVKGGDIKISSFVNNIKGFFITIPIGLNGGHIISEKSIKKLIINGALYGKINKLIDNRIIVENKNGYIIPGTIVNFSSKFLKNPPPLIGNFINDYLKAKKVSY